MCQFTTRPLYEQLHVCVWRNRNLQLLSLLHSISALRYVILIYQQKPFLHRKIRAQDFLLPMAYNKRVFITIFFTCPLANKASLVAQLIKESSCNVGDLGSIPELGRSPGEGKGYPLQCSGLENSMDGIVPRVAKSQTRLSDFHLT